MSALRPTATFGAQLRVGLSSGSQAERHLAFDGGNSLRLNTLGGLWIEDAPGVIRQSVRPRRLALLAVLAAAGARGTTRERVLAILWPESPPEKARHALSQTLYSLRQDLGTEVVEASVSDLRIDPTRLTSDIEELRSALASKEWSRAAALYAGPFLDGFYLAGAPEFERWAEEERGDIARQAARALEEVGRSAVQSGKTAEAADAWQRLTRIDPLSARWAAYYMEALIGLGRREEAAAHGQAFLDRASAELDLPPDDRVSELVQRARTGGPRATPVPPVAMPSAPRRSSDRHPRVPAYRLTRPRVIAGLVAIVAVIATTILLARRDEGEAAPVIAVGTVQDLVTPDSVQLGGVLSEMLATSLGRLTNLRVVANSRILELMPPGSDTVRAARTEASRRAGATEVLEGELMMGGDRLLHLDVRRVDLERGIVRRAYRASGTDRLTLFDSVTTLIASDLGLAVPVRALGDITTRSPLAYRLYEEGLRAFFQYDVYAANRLLRSAVTEDSSFAMAVYYAWRSEVAIGGPDQAALADRAVALASRAADRDRMLILTHVGLSRGDLRAMAAAESLATVFANDPEALIRAAEATADLSRATELLERAIAMDSATASRELAVCRTCEALGVLARRYAAVDSTDAVERTYRRWARLRPWDHAPWAELGDYLVGLGRRADAKLALARADSLDAPDLHAAERRLARSLRADDFDTADSICAATLAGADREQFLRFRRPCGINLRMQQRYREALELLAGRAAGSRITHRNLPRDVFLEFALELDMGRAWAAAQGFSQATAFADADSTLPSGRAAGVMTWNLALAATALADYGDTLRVRSLLDSIRAIGLRSVDPSHARLHHYVRGLLLSRQDDHEAALREFRLAMFFPSHGFTRINAELANSLVALGRPREAIPVLRAALHGELGEPELLVTRTEIHERMAAAFERAGEADSAAYHRAIVTRALRERQADGSRSQLAASVR